MVVTEQSRHTPHPLPGRRVAATVGLLSVAAAVGTGHLVAGLLAPRSSPFLAVGDAVVRLSPSWLTEFAKGAFGTADKPVLLAGTAVLLVVVAAVIGLAARRRVLPGVVGVVGLGLAGLLAVVTAPGVGPVDLVAPLAAPVAGVAVLGWLRGLAGGAGGGRPAGGGPSRRAVLIGSSVAVGLVSVGAGLGGALVGGGLVESRRAVSERLARIRPARAAPAIPAGAAFPESGTPPFVTANPDFYRVDVALRVPAVTAEEWRLRVHGMVDDELTLTFDDLLARPLLERTITMTCVSNEVGGPYISTATFLGVDLREVLREAGVRPGADQVLSTSTDGWTAGTPLDVLLEPERGALLAVGMNGEALPPEHGFPVRMVVPGLYGFVSATKWVVDLEVTTFAERQAYWLQRGWGRLAPIKTQCRIDSPRGFATAPAGRVVVAGIAWSQPVGIGGVEVRVDGGPWQGAELATEVGGDTWRMWRTAFDLAPGSHTVQARATDRDGVTQTEERAAPIPDGASGWPALIFTVS
ncbi:molybdopterin-dependent oxidoreductase [Pseudonocardia humida]|uniref:Molybdopterin-dependent oxidoreductase n=1 Tax=Pseudonocardia humida TaxID=2800819 RepID=A0ABT1A188_9PSEU|nr:molybdopterin-dependent oxidoreductase [Pseudonocardia humida]MCO1656769.1 molybdopterin-dependent oxidoreductase [Pseudonocardia humida]